MCVSVSISVSGPTSIQEQSWTFLLMSSGRNSVIPGSSVSRIRKSLGRKAEEKFEWGTSAKYKAGLEGQGEGVCVGDLFSGSRSRAQTRPSGC